MIIKQISIWLLITITLILIYSFRFDIYLLKDRIISELVPNHPVINKDKSVSFKRSLGGHFYVKARINGSTTKFLIDTGATDISISLNTAKQFGINLKELKFDRTYFTASGTIQVAPIQIQEITIGPIILRNLKASVRKISNSSSLLGMSFLTKLKKYEIKHDTITLWQ